MIRIGRQTGWWLTAGAALLAVCVLQFSGLLRPLENFATDLRARMLKHERRSDIVIVGIDAASIQALDHWPWPRRHHAKLLEKLRAATPQRLFLDVDFSSASNSLDDAVLAAELARRRSFPVVLPVFFQNANGADDRLFVNQPLPRFAHSADLAVVNGEPGRDGVTREWRNFWNVNDERLATIIDPRRSLAESQSVTIDFSISPSSFNYVSYVDVLEGRVAQEQFAGKQVFVGATALELGDMLAVPVYGQLPGIVVQALATETVSAGVPRRLGTWASIALLAGLGVAGGAAVCGELASQSRDAGADAGLPSPACPSLCLPLSA